LFGDAVFVQTVRSADLEAGALVFKFKDTPSAWKMEIPAFLKLPLPEVRALSRKRPSRGDLAPKLTVSAFFRVISGPPGQGRAGALVGAAPRGR
jgi:hypothetical protein